MTDASFVTPECAQDERSVLELLVFFDLKAGKFPCSRSQRFLFARFLCSRLKSGKVCLARVSLKHFLKDSLSHVTLRERGMTLWESAAAVRLERLLLAPETSILDPARPAVRWRTWLLMRVWFGCAYNAVFYSGMGETTCVCGGDPVSTWQASVKREI